MDKMQSKKMKKSERKKIKPDKDNRMEIATELGKIDRQGCAVTQRQGCKVEKGKIDNPGGCK